MAEEKRRRGRPKNQPKQINNEEEEMIKMSKSSKKTSRVIEKNLDNGVGVVSDPLINTPQQYNSKVSLDDVTTRWQTIFGRYSKMGFDTIADTWGQTINMVDNPFLQNRRLKQINTASRKYSKEDLENIIGDPENHEDELRAVSWYMYYTQYIYQMITRLNSEVPKYNYYYHPLYLENKNSENLKKDSILVDKILKSLNPKLTFSTIANQVAVEGKCSYLVRTSYTNKDVNYLVLQKLNSDNIKITGLGSKQRFIVSFNMAIFLQAGYSITQYPKFIQDTWKEMLDLEIVVSDKRGNLKINPKASLPQGHILENKNSTWFYWCELPQDLAWTFYSDGSNINAFPDMLGMLEPFSTLQDYQWLQGSLLSKGVNSILTMEVPLI